MEVGELWRPGELGHLYRREMNVMEMVQVKQIGLERRGCLSEDPAPALDQLLQARVIDLIERTIGNRILVLIAW